MQSSIQSFFQKTTPEKNSTPEKSSNSSSPSKLSSPSPSKSKTTPKKNSPSPAKKSPKNSKSENAPEKEKVSRKRKVEEDDEEQEDAKRLKEDPVPSISKKSFSSDDLLDDDSTLSSLDMPGSSESTSSKTIQEDNSISDEALSNMEMPTTPSKNTTTTTHTTTTNTTPSKNTPAKSFVERFAASTTSTPQPSSSKIASVSGTKTASIFQLGGGGAVSESVTNIAKILTEKSWKAVLDTEFKKPYFATLVKFLDSEKAIKNNKIYPPEPLIFNAFNHASFDKVRVVILGQDPYINYNQAMGMSFSVPRGTTPPPSLKNIFKELSTDIPGFQVPNHGDLTKWADQGVFLLNAVLTVQAGNSNSHKGKGWEQFTAAAIKAINTKKENVVFMLWGKDAQTNASGVDTKKHLVLKSVHPSPMAADRGFFGCKHFSKANKYLEENGLAPIDWSL